MRILILGGTGDAADLAAQAIALPGIEVISSLAGRTQHPTAPIGQVRVGGFGGVAGLIDYLQQQQIDGLIDATHPFAAQISHHAATAAQTCQIPYLLFIRPAWSPTPADRWIEVDSVHTAAQRLPDLAQRVFLTIGRQELAAFAHLQTLWFLMRMIDPPQTALPPGKLIYDRGPFTLDNERSLLIDHQIDTIVSKNSGGSATYAKIIAARQLHLPILIIQRPLPPPGPQAHTIEAALTWLTLLSPN